MARILYGVSPIGLGHATRALVVAKGLSTAGNEVRFFSGGKTAEFLRSMGWQVDGIVSDPAPAVVRGEMKRASLWYVRSWVGLKATTRRTRKLFESFRPDLVVCDEEFSGLGVAMKSGCKNAFISDELQLGFARGWLSRNIENRVERWYRHLQASADMLIIPELGQNSGNRRYVGPIVRDVTATATETREKYSLPEGRMVLLSMSGSDIGAFLLHDTVNAFRRAALPNAFLAISGNRGPRVSDDGIFDLGVVGDNQNLVAAADLVVSTAGKSTIDEAAAAGTPIVVIPIRHHAEQERNARTLGNSNDDIRRLPDLMREKVGRREQPQEFGGGSAAADAILSML